MHSAELVIKPVKIHSREPEPVAPFQAKPCAPRGGSHSAKAPAPLAALWCGGNDCHLLPWTSAGPFLFMVHERDDTPPCAGVHSSLKWLNLGTALIE